MGEKSFLWKCLWVSLALHLITAYFSVGYHSADEQFQILEFLSYKLGGAPAADLSVEFREKMRPWLQPAIYYGMTRGLQFFGIESPFTWAFAFRVFAGLMGWLSVVGMALSVPKWFKDPRAHRFAWATLALIWCFPVLHVRPSSESLAGSSFMIGACLITWELYRSGSFRFSRWLAAGAFFGLSFESRFQMGLMVFGAAAWVLLVSQRWTPAFSRLGERAKAVVAICAGFALLFALGRMADRWGHGDWSFAPYNYVNYNLIRGLVTQFSQRPWWDVFRMSFTETWPFVGTALAVATVIAWIRHPLHLLTWSQLPFFFVHEWIAHKELRFFFPIVFAGPILLTLAFYSAKTQEFLKLPKSWAGRSLKALWIFLVVNNVAALLILCFMPFARTAQFYEGLYKQIPPGVEKMDLYTVHRDPYEVLASPIHFYRARQVKVHQLGSVKDFESIRAGAKETVWFFDHRARLPEDFQKPLAGCAVVYSTYPQALLSLITKLGVSDQFLERTNTWTLYQCTRSN